MMAQLRIVARRNYDAEVIVIRLYTEGRPKGDPVWTWIWFTERWERRKP